jgi:OmpA-OmpF porin, OOP family
MGMRATLRALILLGIYCTAGVTANAGEWYATPSIVYTNDDKERLADDGLNGGQIAVGYKLNDRWYLEGMTGYSSMGGYRATGVPGNPFVRDDVSIWEGSVNALFALGPETRLNPYLIGGIGIMSTSSNFARAENSTLANLGAGVMYQFGNSPMYLRLEYRGRFEIFNTLTYTDQITSLGLQYAFGRTRAPLPAPPAAVDGDDDGDRVLNSRDACPDTPAGEAVDVNGCPRDSDEDGVTDSLDQCPYTVLGVAVDEHGCEFDSDNDNVVDRRDECPNTTPGVPVDVRGCEIRAVINLPGVSFHTNSDRLVDGAEADLNAAAETLRLNKNLSVEVAGYTDSSGTALHNLGLSDRRANTVRDYLIKLGVNPDRLTARGYGEADPISDNATPEGRDRNRRVELHIRSH